MSTTEAEAITALNTSVATVGPAISDLKTAVDAVVKAAGDDPVKVAALDNVAAGLTKMTADLTALTAQINAALVPVP